MDTRTGEFHELKPGETLEELAKRLGTLRQALVEVKRLPDGRCAKCGGRGSIPAGLNSKRWKPCKCVQRQNDVTRRLGA
jgi:hypothetical protein